MWRTFGPRSASRSRSPRLRNGIRRAVERSAMQRLNAIFKDPISGLTHLATALLALVGLVFLLIYSPPAPLARLALLTYGLSLVLLFAASSTYHLVKTTPSRELWLRKFDHVAIYLLIAGTYTPVCAIVMQGFWRWGLLAIIWSLAVIGI